MAGTGGIEDNIMDQIENATGEQFDVDTDVDQDFGQDQHGGDDYQLPPREEVRRQREEAPREDRQTQQTDQRGPQARQGDPKGQRKQEGPRTDAKGNIVDENGNIIAKGGAERRINAQVERLRQVNTNLEQRYDQAQRALETINYLNGLPRQYNLASDDVKDALEIAAQFKTDPVKGAQAAIERALAAGANLRDIVSDEFIPNVQIGAVNRVLDERLKPLEQERQRATDVDRVNREALEAATAFYADYPEAEMHDPVISRLIPTVIQEFKDRRIPTPHPYVIAQEALRRVQQFALKNGLDFEQPLGPQVEALVIERGRQQQQPQRGRQPQNGQRGPVQQQRRDNRQPPVPPTRRPMPNGSGGGVEEHQRVSLSASASSDAIVREAMREAGYQI